METFIVPDEPSRPEPGNTILNTSYHLNLPKRFKDIVSYIRDHLNIVLTESMGQVGKIENKNSDYCSKFKQLKAAFVFF
jgi:hypothetical protein